MENQTGRSILEILGVLAVIGILSVTGLKGYTIAMNRHKANELLDDANKRAATIAIQIMTGREDLSTGDFENNTPYGTFGTPVNDPEGGAFSIPLTNVEEEVCAAMKTIVGEGSSMAIAGECGSDLALCFNADLSRGVSVVNGTCIGGLVFCTSTAQCPGSAVCNNNRCVCSLTCVAPKTLNTKTCLCAFKKTCTTTSDCPGAAYCPSGECVCDLTCTSPKVLNDSMCACVTDPIPCTSDSQCPGSAICPNNTCVCNLTCPSPKVLNSTRCICVDPTPQPTCTTTCTAPQVLDETTCTCVDPEPQCTTTCTAPQVLDETTCTCVDPEPQCTTTCTAPQVLDETTCTCVDPEPQCTTTCTAPQVLDETTCTCVDPSPQPTCTTTPECPGEAICVEGECVCSLSSCVQQYYYPDQTSCSCVDCAQTHFTLITDVPQACCEKPVTDGGIGGEWNQQNDNLCHCPGKDEYWSEQQQQCLSPAPCPNPPCESECQQGQVSCNGSCVIGDCCTSSDCTGTDVCNTFNHTCQPTTCSGNTPNSCFSANDSWCCSNTYPVCANSRTDGSSGCLCSDGTRPTDYYDGSPISTGATQGEMNDFGGPCACETGAVRTRMYISNVGLDPVDQYGTPQHGWACCITDQPGVSVGGALLGGSCCGSGTYIQTSTDACGCTSTTTYTHTGVRENGGSYYCGRAVSAEAYQGIQGFDGDGNPYCGDCSLMYQQTQYYISDSKFYSDGLCTCAQVGDPKGRTECPC